MNHPSTLPAPRALQVRIVSDQPAALDLLRLVFPATPYCRVRGIAKNFLFYFPARIAPCELIIIAMIWCCAVESAARCSTKWQLGYAAVAHRAGNRFENKGANSNGL